MYDILHGVTQFLDVKSSINFITCSKSFLEMVSVEESDINNKIELSHNLSNMCTSTADYFKYGFKSVEFALNNGYYDVLLYLAKELPEFTFVGYLNKCQYNNTIDNNTLHEFFEYITIYYNNLDKFYDLFCDVATKNDDVILINKLVGLSANNLLKIIVNYASAGNYDKFKYYYNSCKNICFCDDADFFYKNGEYRLYTTGKYKLVNDVFIINGAYELITSCHCHCGCDKDTYTLTDSVKLLKHAIIGKNKKIRDFLIDNGNTNYDDGLIGAITINDVELVKYFLDRGANYYKRAANKAVSLQRNEIIELLYKRVGNMDIFEDSKLELYNPIGLCLKYSSGVSVDIISMHKSFEKIVELNWEWIIEPLEKFIPSIHHHLSVISAEKGNLFIFDYCKKSDISELKLSSAVKGQNINIVKKCTHFTIEDLCGSLIIAIKSKDKEIIDYIYDIFVTVDDKEIDWPKLLVDIYFTENQEWFDWCHEKHKTFTNKVISYHTIRFNNPIKISPGDIRRSKIEHELRLN
jgi:hypothetical protein